MGFVLKTSNEEFQKLHSKSAYVKFYINFDEKTQRSSIYLSCVKVGRGVAL